ncbi:MAG TPA: HDOD domain-containing protein [Rhodoferax sp.]|jgi:HD-like signal output (HDOD) protein|nr:HDOD domain-containing protein [Rhodoferax sp.]HNV59800.1 HDOD domain-containing protein [Rhodoferax sp.]HPW28823.1 HDOD domain-containing protein [Rhodoferax sp.]
MSDRIATVERLFAAMKSAKGFAALENTVAALISSLGNDTCVGGEVVGHIVEDFALTQKVLRLANSPMYAPFSDGSGSVSSALEVLGTDALLHIALSTALVTDAEMHSDESLSTSLLSSELARTLCADRGEDVSIAALMYNLGEMLLQKYLPAESAAIAQKVASGIAPTQAATDVLGLTPEELGAEVARRWKLPGNIVSVIDGTGDADLVAIARFAKSASTMIHAGKPEAVDQMLADLNVNGIDKSGLSSLIRQRATYVAPSPEIAPVVSNEDVLNDLFAALTADKKQTVEALAAAMFPTFAATLQTAHCLLFMLTKSGDFAVRYGYGKGIDELRTKLRIGKDYQPTAFHAAIKNNVDVSIADVSRLKVSALPDGYTLLLPYVNKFVILPIANSGVSGLVYCDWDSDTALTANELAAVKKLRNLFLPFFPS